MMVILEEKIDAKRCEKDDEYDEDALFISAGNTIPSTSRPWTVSEARNELSKLNESKLNEKQKDTRLCVEKIDFSLNPNIALYKITKK